MNVSRSSATTNPAALRRKFETKSWTWLTPTERAKRDGRIRELWAMGWTRQELADEFDLTRQRVDQIVRKR